MVWKALQDMILIWILFVCLAVRAGVLFFCFRFFLSLLKVHRFTSFEIGLRCVLNALPSSV